MGNVKADLIFIMQRDDDLDKDIQDRFNTLKCISNKLNPYVKLNSDETNPFTADTKIHDGNPTTCMTTISLRFPSKDHEKVDAILKDTIEEVTKINHGKKPMCYYHEVISKEY